MSAKRKSSQAAEREPASTYFHFDQQVLEQVLKAKLTAAQHRLFLYLSLQDPFGNRPTSLDVKAICQALDISKATFYTAITVLQEKNLFDFAQGEMNVRSKVGSHSPEKLSSKKSIQFSRQASEKIDLSPKNQTSVLENEPESKEEDTQPLKPLTDKGFSEAQYCSISSNRDQYSFNKERESGNLNLKTDNSEVAQPQAMTNESRSGVTASAQDECRDLAVAAEPPDWTTFSAPGAEPAFFEFVMRKTKSFPKPPADAWAATESWIRKQGKTLHGSYLAEKEEERRQAEEAIIEAERRQHRTPREPSAQGHLARLKAKWDVNHGSLRPSVEEWVRENSEWGIKIGPDGPYLLDEASDGDAV